MKEEDIIKYCLRNQMSVNYGKLTICDLQLTSHYKGYRRYQVYCEGAVKFAENYLTMDEAIDKFLELKPTVKSYVY